MSLLEQLPKFYGSVKEIRELMGAEDTEVNLLKSHLDDTVDQLFIDTATWGLSIWERVCGINTDVSKPYEQRRSVIKSKIRGVGTVTAALIKNVVDSYTNGQVEIIESPSTYTIEIKFTSAIGIPPNMADAEKALREIIPAHLGFNFIFRYLLVKDIHNVMTITELENTQLNKFAGGGVNA